MDRPIASPRARGTAVRRGVLAWGVAMLALLLVPVEAGAATATRVARLDFGTGLAFTPSGRLLFVNERGGRIRLVRDGRLVSTPVATIPTTTSGEAGLLGLALHPLFEEGQPWIYVFHTTPDGESDQVVRLRFDGRRARDQQVILRGLPAEAFHHGGPIAFGPDGNLYIAHGDASDRRRARDPRTLGGKIYRIDDDGSVPGDNPFEDEPTWSYGHRNPFGLAFDPLSGRLWESENGPQANDELNIIRRGRSHGWPAVMGSGGAPRHVDPVVDYREIIVPTGLAFPGDAFAARYRQSLFLGVYLEQEIRELRLDGARSRVTSERVFVTGHQPIFLATGPDGLYFTTPEGLFRVRLPRARAPASPTPTETSAVPRLTPSPTTTGTSPWLIALAVGIPLAAVLLALALRRG